MRHAIIIFTKVPKAGATKTRLTADRGGIFTPEEAKEFYEASLLDVIDHSTASGCCDVYICYNQDGDGGYLKALVEATFGPNAVKEIFQDNGGTFDCAMQYAADYIMKNGARVRSLQEPTKKMSKSDENQNAFISLKDDPDTILRKFKRAVTDSEARVYYAEGKDGVNNLMEIYAAVTGKTLDSIESEFDGKGYGDFKVAVAEAVIESLRPVQEHFNELMKDKATLEKCYTESAQKALAISQRTLDKVMKKIGFIKRGF
jgi:hypothetical protein